MYPGGILLKIHKMYATFGKLQGQTLELKDGLNIIEAPNETGKSTWCAFLSSMFYGVNSRDRGLMADKNRYAPWNGSPMSGRMDCKIGQREVTLIRETRRPGAPMAELSAVWSGTGQAIPGITAQNCGEAILGVPREIFERSAFIRQAGLPIHQDPELEKRIAALISSGEEDTSCSEAVEVLKKQLNRRRHNKTGQLPTLEAELQAKEQQLEVLSDLEGQLAQAQHSADSLEHQVEALRQELEICNLWELREQRQALSQAEAGASQAKTQADAMRQRLLAAQIPDNRDIGRLRGALVNIQTTRRNVEKARDERDEAMKAVLRAEAPVNDSPFAGQSAESAQREAQKQLPKLSPVMPALLVLAVCGIGGDAYAYYSELLQAAPFYGILAVCGVLGAGALWKLVSHKQNLKALRTTLIRRFGTDDSAAIAQLAEDYTAALAQLEAAQEEVKAKTAAADSLYNALNSNEQAILLEIRRFAPNAHDLTTADELLRKCAMLRKQLSEAENQAQVARVRRDTLGDQLPLEEPDQEPQSPAQPREEVEARLRKAQEALSQAKSSVDQITGQILAKGDPVVLRSEAEHIREEIDRLEQEYDSLALAISALDSANNALQTRFSPALGKRTAEIFRELTGDRYQSVALDRELNLSVQPQGDPVQRDARYLSGGALDQLYLCARLAICQLVLPRDREIPLILDDALANFDDQRCGAILNWLQQEAKTRQIILFTCHSREKAFFEGNCEVSVQRLTESV